MGNLRSFKRKVDDIPSGREKYAYHRRQLHKHRMEAEGYVHVPGHGYKKVQKDGVEVSNANGARLAILEPQDPGDADSPAWMSVWQDSDKPINPGKITTANQQVHEEQLRFLKEQSLRDRRVISQAGLQSQVREVISPGLSRIFGS